MGALSASQPDSRSALAPNHLPSSHLYAYVFLSWKSQARISFQKLEPFFLLLLLHFLVNPLPFQHVLVFSIAEH